MRWWRAFVVESVGNVFGGEWWRDVVLLVVTGGEMYFLLWW